MRKGLLWGLLSLCLLACQRPLAEREWVSSTMDAPWQAGVAAPAVPDSNAACIEILPDSLGQEIEGFGVAFSEKSWQALSCLSEEARAAVLDELFIPGQGACLTINRTPIGANDFSLDWYSYDEVDGDFGMASFSVARDEETLLPLIREALRRNPGMKIWASPWCPPSWMKYNHHYAMRPASVNDLPESGRGVEGRDMFIQEDAYFDAYALYFEKYILAYRERGVLIAMVMPQNEPNSDQVFPSCCWTSAGQSRFLSRLGPRMEALGVEVWLGTCERPSLALIDSILTHPEAGRHIRGVGFQWAGKKALPLVREKYPDLPLMETEQECGDGRNDWRGAMHSWELMKHYFSNGVRAYDYWNLALLKDGLSRWGWRQNSLLTVDPDSLTGSFTIEYYLLKHVSHYVQHGARLIRLDGEADALAFLNPDGSVILVTVNPDESVRPLRISLRGRECVRNLPPRSIHTFVF